MKYNRTIKNLGRAIIFSLSLIGAVSSIAQNKPDEKAEAIINKAVEKLGGDKYLQVKTQIGKGRYSQIAEKQVASFQSFTDIIVFPDKERTEFQRQRWEIRAG